MNPDETKPTPNPPPEKLFEIIRGDYINDGNAGYRELAKKYGIPFSKIAARGKSEHWSKLRRENQKRGSAPISAATSDDQIRTERLARLCELADRVVDRLSVSVTELETTDTQRFRQIVASIKEIKDIQMLHSPIEQREQLLKLQGLERQMRAAEAEDVSGGEEIIIRIEGGEDYSE